MMFENFSYIIIIIISDSDKLFLFWSNVRYSKSV